MVLINRGNHCVDGCEWRARRFNPEGKIPITHLTENDMGLITCLSVKTIKILISCVVQGRPQATCTELVQSGTALMGDSLINNFFLKYAIRHHTKLSD